MGGRAGLLAAVASLAWAALPPATPPWREVRSAHCVIFAQADGARARALALNLETLEVILRTVSPDLRRAAPDRIQVPVVRIFAFARKADMDAFAQHRDLTGFFTASPEFPVIVLSLEGDAVERVAAHEYLHHHNRRQTPGLPLWANEGLATFFETLAVQGRVVQLGAPPTGYLETLVRSGPLPVARLLAVEHDAPEYRDPALRPRFYATAWFLVEHLMTAGNGRRAQFGAFLDQLRAGRSATAAWAAAMPDPPATLDAELASLLHRVVTFQRMETPTLTFRELAADPALSDRPMSRAESLARLGWLCLGLGPDRAGEAAELFAAAVALDPDAPGASLGQAFLASRQGRQAEAVAAYRRAAEAEPMDPAVARQAGLVLAAACREPGAVAADRAEARALLVRALELGPTRPDVMAALVILALSERGEPRRALADLDRACALRPRDWPARLALAQIMAGAGEADRAEAELQAVAGQFEALAEARQAQEELRQRAARAVEDLRRHGLEAFNRGDYGQAEADLREALRRAGSSDQQRRSQESLDAILALIQVRRARESRSLAPGGAGKSPKR